MEVKNRLFEGMTPKEKEIFVATYPRFAKEIVPMMKQYAESKGWDTKEPLTNEQQNEMVSSIMPNVMPIMMDMISSVENADMFTFMNAFSKGMSNLRTIGQADQEGLGNILDK